MNPTETPDDSVLIRRKDSAFIDAIVYYLDPIRCGCQNKSVKISARQKNGRILWRVGGGKWFPSLREALEDLWRKPTL